MIAFTNESGDNLYFVKRLGLDGNTQACVNYYTYVQDSLHGRFLAVFPNYRL